MFEWASALDAGGHEAQAVAAYETALRGGLREPHRHQALIQLGSSLRVVGRASDAVSVLSHVATARPESVAARAFMALALRDSGRADEAVRVLLEALVAHAGDADDIAYRPALLRYAATLTAPPAP